MRWKLFFFFFCINRLGAQDFNLDNVSTKYLRFNFIIVQNEEGKHNFSGDSVNHIQFLKNIEDLINYYMWAFEKEVQTDSGYVKVKFDTKIRYKLDTILFLKQQKFWNSDQQNEPMGCPDAPFKKWWLYDLHMMLKDSIECVNNSINVYLTNDKTRLFQFYSDTIPKHKIDKPFLWCSRQPSLNLDKDGVVNATNLYLDYLLNKEKLSEREWMAATVFAHEFGHMLFLSFVHEDKFKNLMTTDWETRKNFLSQKQLQEAHENIFNTNMKKYLFFKY